MKILILCDHYPLSPRVKKLRNSLLKLYPGSVVKVFAWNRENNLVKEDYVETFNQNIGYGNKIGKALNLVKFLRNSKLCIKKFKPTHVHAIDIEMLIVSGLILKNEKLIYEVYDIKFYKPKIVKFIREKIETFFIKKYVNSIIFASPFFDNYYTQIGIENILKVTLNNKPSCEMLECKDSHYMNPFKKFLDGKLVIGFIGTVRYSDILINLIDSSRTLDDIIILIAGNGPSYNYIKDYITHNDLKYKVIMTGRYESNDLKSIYNVCDYIWAAYPNNDFNVKYAISNKFFESMVFNKKVIVSRDTMLGDYIEKENVGFTIDPYNTKQIIDLLRSLNKSNINNNIVFDDGLYWEDEEEKLSNIY